MRELTGKWYIKRKLFGFKVMVEVLKNDICEFDFSYSPEYLAWEEARPEDLIRLTITIL